MPNFVYTLFFLFLTGCAGFYTKSEQSPTLETLKSAELNVIFEVSFHNGKHFVDEIEISSKADLENKVNELKDNIINSLKIVNPNKKINLIQNIDLPKTGCILKIIIDETFNTKSMLASTLTFFIWPYIDIREVTIRSGLVKESKRVSESSTSRKYKTIFSLFVIPLAPFMIIENADKRAWEDAYNENLSKN
jgi:hypothetical protein